MDFPGKHYFFFVYVLKENLAKIYSENRRL